MRINSFSRFFEEIEATARDEISGADISALSQMSASEAIKMAAPDLFIEPIKIDTKRRPKCTTDSRGGFLLEIPVCHGAVLDVLAAAQQKRHAITPSTISTSVDYNFFVIDSIAGTIGYATSQDKDDLLRTRTQIEGYINGLNQCIPKAKEFIDRLELHMQTTIDSKNREKRELDDLSDELGIDFA